ncbi:MAG: isopentenyl-diphosphate delta-isomerase Idi [Parcubacteria group bacterium Gr01-1014_31]|nr:MAG: isopentenyl-diphosphate delta-isomerase Idi [Parcubacteria group bacterium Gr01-1014_31]
MARIPSVEHVVLIDDNDQVLGVAPKATVHGSTTPLHRGFSLFLFNRAGELLLQQRALHKLTWPGAWSNSVCGHPAADETASQAAVRRTREELGLTLQDALQIAPYRYRFRRQGVEENEICPLVVATTRQTPSPNPEEVAAIRWVGWNDFLREVRENPGRYSEWCEEEIVVLDESPAFRDWYLQRFGK